MTAALVVQGLLAGALLAGAAALAEAVLRGRGLPGRWPWLGALAGSTVLPVWSLLGRGDGGAAGVRVEVEPLAVGALAGEAGTPQALLVLDTLLEILPAALARGTGLLAGFLGGVPGGDTTLVALWLLASAVLAALFVGSAGRLRRRVRSLPTRKVEERIVRISERLGPAVVGVLSPWIVLPRWLLHSPPEARRLAILHEEEHLRGHDTVLLAAGLGCVVLAPWNPALWFQAARLRRAIELDCDRRVVRRGAHPTRYAALLLEVGSRARPLHLAAAALAEPPSLLERRMRALCTPTNRIPAPRAVLGGLLALALTLVACEAPTPLGDPPEEPAAPGAAGPETPVPGDAGPPEDPAPVAYSVPPRLLNTGAAMEALQREYPPALREAGIGGQVQVHVLIGTDGAVRETRLIQGSGHEALDAAALRVAPEFRFSPARDGEEAPLAVWISLPITFQAPEDAGQATGPLPPAPTRPQSLGELEEGPAFTPYTLAPSLRNVAEAQAALEREYPPLLRDAGIGGRALVHFLLDAEGGVRQVRIAESSGHEALDEAALRVARTFRFSPALNREEPVPVWIALPIRFTEP